MRKWNKQISKSRMIIICIIALAVTLLFIYREQAKSIIALALQGQEAVTETEDGQEKETVYATSHKEETALEDKTVNDEKKQPQASEKVPEPKTKIPIQLKDVYVPPGEEVTLRSFYPEAISYTWESYNAETKAWEEKEEKKGMDELYREVSQCTIICEESLSPIILRCRINTPSEEYIEVAAIHTLKKEITDLAATPFSADAGSYLRASDIPVSVTYEDGTREEITGLYGLYWQHEEEEREYGLTLSGNRMEKVTKVLTDLEYHYVELGKTETVLSYRGGKEEKQVFLELSGEDLQMPDILNVEVEEGIMEEDREEYGYRLKVTAVDNHTPYSKLSYCFLPKGDTPKERDWKQNPAGEIKVKENTTYMIYVRDENGNTNFVEKDIVVEKNSPPKIRVSLENTALSQEGKILVEALDEGVSLYSFTCEETGEDSGWIDTSEYRISNNGLWTISAKDTKGNITTEQLRVSNIDNQPPNIIDIIVTTKNTKGENE